MKWFELYNFELMFNIVKDLFHLQSTQRLFASELDNWTPGQ